MIIETKTPQETFEVGKKIGENAKPGQIYTLTGDLGVGKTVFTQGVAAGLGITEPICSPTFTIIQEYESGRLPLYHFDVYRIGDIEEMDEIGYEDYFYGNGLCMIEWANLIEEILPEKRHDISIEKDLEKALYWTRRAAEHGDRDGQYNLAEFYEDAIGVERDIEQAKHWYRLAALQNDDLAIEKCKELGIAL
mgnify:CR=1 FL=1